MTIYVVYSCIVLIIVKIYQTSIVITFKIKQNNEFHSYNTRNSTKLHVSYKRTNYRKYTVFNKDVTLWNNINEDIKNTNSYLSLIKKKAKLYYLVSD